MSSLYELTSKYLYLQEMLEYGQEDDEKVQEYLTITENDLEEKAENYGYIIRNFEADIESLKAEEKRLKEKRSRLEKSVNKLKETLETAMIITGKRQFKKGIFNFNIQTNGGSLPVIVDVETDELPDDLVIVSEKPDLKAIAKYIEETGDITFAHFGERGESLRIK